MLKFTDLSVGDYVLWGKQKSNIDGDYDIEFGVRQLTLGDFLFMEENVWNEQDLNEFVKPIEITHEIMEAIGWKREKGWAGVIHYGIEEHIPGGVEYKGCHFSLRNIITVKMHEGSDEVENITTDCFNNEGYFKCEKSKRDEPFYVHELQHILRECGIGQEIELKEGN